MFNLLRQAEGRRHDTSSFDPPYLGWLTDRVCAASLEMPAGSRPGLGPPTPAPRRSPLRTRAIQPPSTARRGAQSSGTVIRLLRSSEP